MVKWLNIEEHRDLCFCVAVFVDHSLKMSHSCSTDVSEETHNVIKTQARSVKDGNCWCNTE